MPAQSNNAFFFAKLAALTKAGFPLTETWRIAIQEYPPGKVKKIYISIFNHLQQGSLLAEQIAGFPQLFSLFERALINSGEQSGRLTEVFQILAAWHRFRTEIIKRLRSALLYPLLLLHALAFIAPVKTLLLGQITLGASIAAVAGNLLPMYLAAAAILWLFRRADRTHHFDTLLLKVPILGKGLYYLALSRFCFAFEALYVAGADLRHSIALARAACGNREVAAAFLQCETQANHGYRALWQSIAANVPADFTGLWRAGEESGKLEETLQRLAAHWHERAMLEIRHFAQWLPKLCYFAIVITIAFSLIQDRFNGSMN